MRMSGFLRHGTRRGPHHGWSSPATAAPWAQVATSLSHRAIGFRAAGPPPGEDAGTDGGERAAPAVLPPTAGGQGC